MGNRITSVRVKRPDGTYSNEIPISPSADKVIWKDNEHNLEEILGNVDTTKPIQNQINQKVNTAELQEYIDTELAGDVDDWLDEHITIPDEAYTLDDTLSTATSAAPAKTVGDIVHESIAPKFSSLLNYKIGDCVFYENHFYKFIEDHAAGAWNATHVEVADDLAKQISTKAEQDGYYSDITVGDAEQLVATEFIEDDELYTFRKAGGNYDIGNRQYDQLEGGTICWNQLVQNGNFSDGTTLSNWIVYDSRLTSKSVSNGILSVVASTSNVFLRQSNVFKSGHHNLISVDIKLTTGGTYIQVRNASAQYAKTSSDTTNWQNLSFITSSDNAVDTYLEFYDKRSSDWDMIQFKNVQCFDLTAMFGTEIADYIYSLEQANQGDGVAWFKKYFPKDYYAYDPGSLQSVNVASHDTVGFNQWDEEWEVGQISMSNGTPQLASNSIRSKNFCECLSNTAYYMTCSKTDGGSDNKYYLGIAFYDVNKNYISSLYCNNQVYTTPSNAKYFKITTNTSAVVYGQTYNHDICINISDPSRNGEYEPYNKHIYPYDSLFQLRGIPKLVDSKLTYDGDIYQSNGTVIRKYGIVDLGTLDWDYISDWNGAGVFTSSQNLPNCKTPSSDADTFLGISDMYPIASRNRLWGVLTLLGLSLTTSGKVYVRNSSYESTATFKTAMSGVYLVYELATPTTETAAPFVYSQEVDGYGTEEYVDAGVLATTRDVSVPVGHHTKYPPNLRDKLQHLPFLAEEDGDYYIQQSNKNMTLKKMEGDFENIVAGSAKQLLSDSYVENTDIYQFRKSANGMAIGERQLVKEITGESIVWNQLVQNGNFSDDSNWSGSGGTISISNNILTFTVDNPRNSAAIIGNVLGTVENHKYFVCAEIKYNNNLPGDNVFIGSGGYQGIAVNRTSFTLNKWIYASGFFIRGTGGNDKISIYPRTATLSNGDTVDVKNVNIFDLTAMFGSTIADYIYSLETANEGDGVAFFKKFFPKDYYEYNLGEIKSVGGLSEHKTVGFNQWDEEWELGTIDSSGQQISHNSRVRSKNYIPIINNTIYYCASSYVSTSSIWGLFYDIHKNVIPDSFSGTWWSNINNSNFISPKNARYMKIVIVDTTYNHNICINISDPAKNGTYEPYKSNSYPLDSSVELRGIPKLDVNNKLYYDGDRYLANGVVERRYGIVDLGTLGWSYGTYFAADVSGKKAGNFNLICSKYKTTDSETVGNMADKEIKGNGSNSAIVIKDSTYTDANTFTTAMSGVMLVYELATPTTEQAQPYQEIQIVDGSGTEEFVTTSLLPPQCTTQYYENMREKLEKLPHTAASQGDYIITQSNGKMSLKPDVSWHKADIDGHYENLTAGTADQLSSNVFVQDSEPYVFRTAGGSANIGDRLEEEIVGGSIVWNQSVRNGNFESNSNWEPANSGSSFSISNGIATITGSVDYFGITQYIPVILGHKYLITSQVKASTTTNEVLVLYANSSYLNGVTLVETPSTTDFITYSKIGTCVASGNTAIGVRVNIYNGEQIIQAKNIMMFDLTAMFSTEIADYIYSLEQANEGDGVAFFRKFFPKKYYEYNPGEIKSVSGLVSHDMRGFNAWDEEIRNGYYDNNGAFSSNSGYVANKNEVLILPNTTYYFYSGSGNFGRLVWLDTNKNFISTFVKQDKNFTITSPNNAAYLNFDMVGAYGTTYKNDICINLAWDNSRNGEYKPYKLNSYALDNTLTLRGIPKLDSNNKLYFDGDRYLANGVVERRYGIVDLGTLNWDYDTIWGSTDNKNTFAAIIPMHKKCNNEVIANIICKNYISVSANDLYTGSDKAIASNYRGENVDSYVRIRDTSYTDAATFKAAMSGVYLVYELATPTTEQATSFTSPQIVDNFGTEEYVISTEDDVIIPVGHNTKYPADLKSKLEMVPESPNGNGDYIVRQTDGTNTYVPLVIPSELPTLPTENGNYILKVTVDGTTKTLSWVAQS